MRYDALLSQHQIPKKLYYAYNKNKIPLSFSKSGILNYLNHFIILMGTGFRFKFTWQFYNKVNIQNNCKIIKRLTEQRWSLCESLCLCGEYFFYLNQTMAAQVIDCIINIPAHNAAITPIANTLKGFLLNRKKALINETVNNAAINVAGAITRGSSFVNITIVSIFIYNLCSLVPYWLNYQVSRNPRAQLKRSFEIFFRTMRSKILSLSEKVSHILFMTCLCSI